jgi:hypothetical protein
MNYKLKHEKVRIIKFRDIIGILGILIALLGWTVFENLRFESCKSNCIKVLDEEFKALVVDKRLIGDNNKGIETLILFTENKETIEFYTGHMHGSILPWCETGDSLIKIKGRFDYKIIKPDGKCLYFNFGVVNCDTICNCK